MTEQIFAHSFLFSVEAVVFGILTFLLWMYYRGFSRQYVKFWAFSLLALTFNQIAFALQTYGFAQPINSPIQIFYEVVKQVTLFLHLTLLLLGLYNTGIKRRIKSKHVWFCLIGAFILGSSIALFYALDANAVFNRFYLRVSLSSFVYGGGLLGGSLYILLSPTKKLSSKILMIYCGVIGTRYLLHSFVSIIALTEDWFNQVSHLLVYFDIGGNTILSFIMLLWMQSAEREHAITAISRAQYLGKHDSLTGALNREQVLEKLPEAMVVAQDNGHKLCVFLIDIKRFKFINDTYGMKAGDYILAEIASRLQESILLPSVVGRLSGDSFIFAVDIYEKDQKERAAAHLHELIEREYHCDDQPINLQCSIGYCLYPDDSEDSEELLQKANIALFHGESHNISSVQFEEGMQDRGRYLLAMEQEILRAIAEDEFVLYFQPQLNLLTNRLEGVEALIRWNHPEKGFLTPGDFLNEVDALGLNSELDNYVLEKACQTIARWHTTYNRRVTIAVNITAVEFQDPKLVAKIQALLFQYDIQPKCLELEITENVVMTEIDTALNTIVILQNMGIKVSIDDFGTGYSSLAYLRKLPIDKIKIDRSFITEVASNDSDLTIVKSMIKLSHGLGKRVLAEGVETAEQLQVLRNLHCDTVQGYFISKPISEEDLAKFLIRK